MKITVFTPTYNRAHLLSDLYTSLCEQTCQDFEWIVIDDGSSDGTSDLFKQWEASKHNFSIKYLKSENRGKCFQINQAVKLAKGEWFFIIDSDDYILPNTIDHLHAWIKEVEKDKNIAGVSGIKVDESGLPLNNSKITIPENPGFVTASNLERSQYGLSADMAECYRTALLRDNPFKIWPGEKFVSEAQIWNKLADEGFLLRWHNIPITICRYQPNGITNSYWTLLKDNPMGFADMFSDGFKRQTSIYSKIRIGLECLSSLMLAGNMKIANQFLPLFFIILAILPAKALYVRRRYLINKYSKS